jgi:hypothetical protein
MFSLSTEQRIELMEEACELIEEIKNKNKCRAIRSVDLSWLVDGDSDQCVILPVINITFDGEIQ